MALRRATQHPIHKLPVEVLTEILGFYCSLDSCFAVTLLNRGTILTPTWALARTCSLWRQIVCSQPAFWSSFDLNFNSIISLELSDILITYIHRSGTTTTLRLNITYPDPESDELDTNIKIDPADTRLSILNILFDNSDRWSDVHFDIGPNVFAHAVSHLMLREKPAQGYFPKLRSLDTQDQESTYFDYAEEDSDRSLFHIFQPCPQLHTLSVHDSWKNDPVDYSHLTYLNLMYYRGQSLSLPLSRCAHLRHFSIGWCSVPVAGDFDYDPVSVWSRDNPFQHRGITRLSLPMYDDHFGEGIWEDLRFPSLTSLDVDQVEESGTGTTELLSLLSRSECTLHTLGIGKIPSNVLANFLSVAPSLQSLTLMSHYTFHASRAETEQMFSPIINPSIVPGLSSLKVEFHGALFQTVSTTDVVRQFRDMVISRDALSHSVELVISNHSQDSSTAEVVDLDSLAEFFQARIGGVVQVDLCVSLTVVKRV